ncbi:MAG: AAA family ATPase, partial [Romboutsia sp.]|nr:AAA family ATPase [Romboutsia sp.]
GEKLEGHGFLIWDCKTLKSPEQCLINNKWGFVDVIIKDKVWINKKDIDMLEFPYIRVCLDNCGQDNIEIRQILEEIQKDKQVQRIIYKPERKMIRKVIETTDKLYNNSNDQHNDLKELLKHNLIQSKTSNDMLKIILELHDEYYKTIKNKVEFTHNNTLWRPLRIEFKKIFIYGGDKANYIDFTNTGIYSITAENANGKSSIKNAILFALFNKIDNHGFTDVLNNKSDEGYVKLEFQYGPNIFLIHRKIIRTTNSGVKSVVDFFQLLPSKKCLNGDSETHTSDLIKDMIGSYDKFIQYNILVNDLPKCDLIKSYTKSNWITCFRKVFNLDITDEYYKVNKLRETELSDEISRLT